MYAHNVYSDCVQYMHYWNISNCMAPMSLYGAMYVWTTIISNKSSKEVATFSMNMLCKICVTSTCNMGLRSLNKCLTKTLDFLSHNGLLAFLNITCSCRKQEMCMVFNIGCMNPFTILNNIILVISTQFKDFQITLFAVELKFSNHIYNAMGLYCMKSSSYWNVD